ncbi:hypothetical protein [Phenylobacterium sp.]|uniref:hypothetical protein n=1 Tax=Phenylobacterium sp. TaxID=1871053 RepID=UPI00273082B5|nr:hypothetical protein [Phenylobacterium sp.]MDP2215413.1 hypothetical protein [Phenylobacterium sp.]
MPCAALAASTLLWMAAGPAPARPETPVPAPATALEPLFADIVARAQGLKGQAETLRQTKAVASEAFKTEIADLAALNMVGQQRVRDRGNDGDLACILRGIAEDLPVKLAALQLASEPADRDLALRELIYLLNDNVEVIIAPPGPSAGPAPGGAI